MKAKYLNCILFVLMSFTASAQDFVVSGLKCSIISNEERTVAVVDRIANDESIVSFVIPSEVTHDGVTYRVTEVANNARYRTLDEIRTIALKKLGNTMKGRKNAPVLSSLVCNPSSNIIKGIKSLIENEAFYVCSSPAGNVIVSTDLCINPILGYSDTPIENMDSIPEGLQYLLDLYAKEHEFIVNSGYVNSSSNNNLPRKIESVTKGPLITTQWGQEEPYNNNCPTRNGTRCLTGCVATAMAQIMYYYKYPNDGTFDWDNMANTYNYNSYTDEQASAVAKLMRSCGSAVGMSYGTSVSTAYNERVNGALVSNFGYLSSIAYVERNKASSESWNELIMSEIDKLHPIYYSGKPDNNYNSTGHAFIVDGYQTNAYGNTLFHVNYGWDGYCDGYYSLGNLQGYN